MSDDAAAGKKLRKRPSRTRDFIIPTLQRSDCVVGGLLTHNLTPLKLSELFRRGQKEVFRFSFQDIIFC